LSILFFSIAQEPSSDTGAPRYRGFTIILSYTHHTR